MRQGQHKSRSRNRGRRPSSSVNRVYESNGPDVKVRGTAQTVADKYLQLARDAQSGGDIVKAESYFQYAEHYLRIVAANQPPSQPSQPRRSPFDGDTFDETDEAGGDEAQRAQAPGAEGESRPEGEAAEAATAQEQPAEAQPAADEGDGKESGDGWDGHQPDFLRRSGSSSNGAETPPKSPRSRREQRPRTPQPELAGSEQPQIPGPEDSANTGENT